MILKEKSTALHIKKHRVIQILVSQIGYKEALDHVFELAKSYVSSYFCFSNAQMMVEAKQDKTICEAINRANMTFADGMSVVAALKFLHKIQQPRIAGMDIIFDILKMASEKNVSIFLFGSEQHILEKFIKKTAVEYPNLKVAGIIAPSFKQITDQDNKNYASAINQSGAGIVLVCLGCPKQELWMAANHKNIHAALLGIGGALPMYVSEVKRAPLFMQKNYLEWLFRLIQEPRRLWKRYLITNTLFIIFVMKQIIFKKNKK